MLKHLHIQNYALIDKLDIEFHHGLNIITGETGAGKSILIGALGLILGQRADTSVLKDKQRSCIVEAMFQIDGYNLKPFFIENDLDYYDNTIIRRQINESGKSRAFVNEIPVNLNVLKDLVGQMVDIHSQHQSLLLTESSFQISVLDSFAGNVIDVQQYSELYRKYKDLNVELAKLIESSSKAKADLDYLQFQMNQLDEAKLVDGEKEELELEHKQLTHADEIKTSFQNATHILTSESQSLVTLTKDAINALSKISQVYPSASSIIERLESCRIELKDIAQETENHFERVEVDPERLEWVNSRLDLIFSLLQKHRLTSISDLITLQQKLRVEVESITNSDSLIEAKKKEIENVVKKMSSLAEVIGKTRRAKSPEMESDIQGLLKDLGMPFASFRIDLDKVNDFLPTGTDRVSFMFSANKQIPLQEISRIASGGELSRLMLSLKSLLVRTKGMPTIIFDEIDSGVSGEVADKMGNIIHRISSGLQVINITHLPQIASKGMHHFLVYKDNESATSKTLIKLLNKDERVVEIAKLLSGETLSAAAMENARHLLAGN